MANRRNFLKNIMLASAGMAIDFKNIKVQPIAKRLFMNSENTEDRVLVLIRLNGGNDGLNTVFPIDQYEGLTHQRSNLLVPENSILSLTDTVGLHPKMTGMHQLFNEEKLGIIQSVGYPNPNRSHFRSTDIWSTGSLDQQQHKGWIGRYLDSMFPNYPNDYPNEQYPDPFAVSMGYEVSATCQGLIANFSQAIDNPLQQFNLAENVGTDDGTYFGKHMLFMNNIISLANKYGNRIYEATNLGSTLSTRYDENSAIARYLRFIARMISGGLKSKVYVLNLNGFDTHNSQVNGNDYIEGTQPNLLKQLSDAVAAFMDDLQLLGLSERVAGMTFSEFGRQIASNASRGTDHGDAAPVILFGSCISDPIIGDNPVIPNMITNQAGVPMQIDFRDVYASMLHDWFEVDESAVNSLFPDHNPVLFPIMQACNTLGVKNPKTVQPEVLVYPNPVNDNTTLKFSSKHELVTIMVYDISGRVVLQLSEKTLDADTHTLTFSAQQLSAGTYQIVIQKASGNQSVRFVKL